MKWACLRARSEVGNRGVCREPIRGGRAHLGSELLTYLNCCSCHRILSATIYPYTCPSLPFRVCSCRCLAWLPFACFSLPLTPSLMSRFPSWSLPAVCCYRGVPSRFRSFSCPDLLLQRLPKYTDDTLLLDVTGHECSMRYT